MGLPTGGYNAGSALARLIIDFSSIALAKREVPKAFDVMAAAGSKWGKAIVRATTQNKEAIEAYTKALQNVENLFKNLKPSQRFSDLSPQVQLLIRDFINLETQLEKLNNMPKEFVDLIERLRAAESARGDKLGAEIISNEDVLNIMRAYEWEHKLQEQTEELGHDASYVNQAYRERSAYMSAQHKMLQRELQLRANIKAALDAGVITSQQAAEMWRKTREAAASSLQLPALDKAPEKVSGLNKSLASLLGTLSSVAAGLGIFLTVESILQSLVQLTRRLVRETLQYFDAMKTAQTFMLGFAGNMQDAELSMSRILRYARESRLPFKDAVSSAQELAPVLAAAGESLEQLPYYLSVARKLAVLNQGSTGGISGAIFSIGEMLSGDVRSIQRRFRVNPDVIREIAEEHGPTYIEALDYFLTNNLGITDDIVEESLRNWSASIERLGDSIGYVLEKVFGGSIDQYLLPFLDHLTKIIFSFGDLLEVINQSGAGLADFFKIQTEFVGLVTGIQGDPMINGLRGFFVILTNILLHFMRGAVILQDLWVKFTSYFKAFLLSAMASLLELGAILNDLLAQGLRKLGLVRVANEFEVLAQAGRELAEEWRNNASTMRSNADEFSAMVDQFIRNTESIATNLAARRLAETPGMQAWGARYQGMADAMNSLVNEAESISEEAVEIWIDYQKRLRDAQASFLDDMAKAERDYQRDRLKRIEDFNKQAQQKHADFIRDQLKDRAKFEEEYNDLISGRTGRVRDLLERVEIERKYAEEEFQEEMLENTQKFYRDLERMREKHEITVLEAAARLDARAVYEENRRYQQEIKDAWDNHRERQAEREKQFADEWEVESKAFQRRLAIAREYDLRRAKEMREAFEERQREERAQHRESMRRMQQEFNDELRERDREHRERINEMRQQHANRMVELRRQMAEAINEELKHNNSVLAIHQRGLESVRAQLENWWKNNAHLFIPPKIQVFDGGTKSYKGGDGGDGGSKASGSLGRFALGGLVKRTGQYLLHSGERVLNPDETKAFDLLFRQGGLIKAFRQAVSGPALAASGAIGNQQFNFNGNIVLGDIGNRSDAEVARLVRNALIDAFNEIAR